ncbi:MAG: zinc-dependent alcohol dehydrogenase [Gemmatimonas sp.]
MASLPSTDVSGAASPRLSATALWYVDRGRAELRTTALPVGREEALVHTSWSGISRGTERLVLAGRVPPSEAQRMRAPLQEGEFPFPVKYGYSAVGTVESGPADLVGRTVFALHPHQSAFAVAPDWLHPLPDGVPPRRAVLAANMETALNAVWDSRAAPGDRIAVIGAGVVGLLVAYLCARLSRGEVVVSDIAPARESTARALGARFAAPGTLDDGFDVVFHTSATADGLASAIAACGNEARIVEMSWYGDGVVAVPLGGAFHSRRLQIVSSQVGQVAPSHRARWTHRRRLAKAIELLADDRLDALITAEVPFADLPKALPGLLAAGAPGLVTAVRY